MRLHKAGAPLWAVVVLVGGGCWSTSFHASDRNFQGAPSFGDPAVYMTRLPAEPYRSVGIIEVEGPGNPSIDEALPRAVEKGKEVGCQVLIWRRLSVESAMPSAAAENRDKPIAVVAQQGLGLSSYNNPQGPTLGGAVRGGKHQFICAVWMATKNPGE